MTFGKPFTTTPVLPELLGGVLKCASNPIDRGALSYGAAQVRSPFSGGGGENGSNLASMNARASSLEAITTCLACFTTASFTAFASASFSWEEKESATRSSCANIKSRLGAYGSMRNASGLLIPCDCIRGMSHVRSFTLASTSTRKTLISATKGTISLDEIRSLKRSFILSAILIIWAGSLASKPGTDFIRSASSSRRCSMRVGLRWSSERRNCTSPTRSIAVPLCPSSTFARAAAARSSISWKKRVSSLCRSASSVPSE